MKKQIFSIVFLTALCTQSVNGMARVTQFTARNADKLVGAISTFGLVGAGSVLSASRTTNSSAEVVTEVPEKVVDNVVMSGVATQWTFNSVKNSAFDKATSYMTKAKEQMNNVVNDIVADYVVPCMATAKEKADIAKDAAVEFVTPYAFKAKEQAFAVKDVVTDFATPYATQLANSAAVKSAQKFAEEHPLATGAIVVATPAVAVMTLHGARNAYKSYKTKKQNRLAEEAALALS